jgi:hypothetical protein
MSAVAQSLIEIDEQGVAWISDTKVKVMEVALDKTGTWIEPGRYPFSVPTSVTCPGLRRTRLLL